MSDDRAGELPAGGTRSGGAASGETSSGEALPEAGFCERCGRAVERIVPADDNRERRVCPNCGHIHYENPKIVVGCLLEWEGRVLLCRRGIEPRHGLWTLPAGFMENGESTLEGAAREAFEEATAEAEDLRLFALYNLPRISQVYVMFHGRLRQGFARANEETLEVGLFEQADIPWSEIAFPVVGETLVRWFEMRDGGERRVYLADVSSRPGSPLEIVRHPA